MDHEPGDVTRLLQILASGERGVMPELVELVYGGLRRIAQARMNAEHPGHTLTPTGLVHEAYLRLSRGGDLEFRDRTHFFAVAAQAMRRILVDYARSRQAAKRGGGHVAQSASAWLENLSFRAAESSQEIFALNDALRELEKLSVRQCQVVELRYFAGLTEEQVAQVLGVTRRTVNRDWALARAWLHRQMRSPSKHDS
jgi:RNA polymerase sigma factor (TIGR02999 family)